MNSAVEEQVAAYFRHAVLAEDRREKAPKWESHVLSAGRTKKKIFLGSIGAAAISERRSTPQKRP
jgi:hypothetical protein